MNTVLKDEVHTPVRPTDEEVSAYYGRPVVFKELVYDLMNGSLNLDDYPVAVSKYIANEYETGGCEELYGEMAEARNRVYEKLGCEYDDDLEAVVDRCFDISRNLCMKMYDYGAAFGK